ncbi:MAG TPA: hypothetical protein VKB59_20950 [Micromonosporaceae bacterium]|nr:hypothetical protein [Micromonosporaceae bacterium]
MTRERTTSASAARWRVRVRVASALTSVVAAVAFVAVGPTGPAGAADTGPIDQITGNGSTNSAVTVSWSQGLLDANNQPLPTQRDPGSPLAFMYPDFEGLTVTVGQTQNLVHQSIRVTWSGGTPTGHPGGAASKLDDFLQMMQCYGDADSGPIPEDCQYGSMGLLNNGSGGSIAPAAIGSRTGNTCLAHSTPSMTNPPPLADGSPGSIGCDTLEPSNPSHTQPGQEGQPAYSVPFIPFNDQTQHVYGAATTFYDQFNTNEVQFASTDANGNGQVFFQTLTRTEAPGLGCGAVESNGKPRDCWLVIVPRGHILANGAPDTIQGINDSPLGASNWAQRIQIHLSFDPIQTNCPIGASQEREMSGTQLVSHAVFSWQLALNQAANCKTLYGFTATSEPQDTVDLSNPNGKGLAFTTIPIGSEAERLNGGASAPNVPPLIYAPVAASVITFGFNINQASGAVTTAIKLTPRLVAKALTQSYKWDLPTFRPSDGTSLGPAWAKNNPVFITDDPEFKALNPGITSPASGSPLAPLLTEDHTGVNQQVWQWIISDAAARKWLAGTPDEHGMVVNPAYQKLNLGKAAIDSYPRADPTCRDDGIQPGPPPKDARQCSLDILPYVNSLDDAAIHVRGANNPDLGREWDPAATAPDGSTGYWDPGGIEPVGRVFMWAVMDSASLANYGLIPADLCNSAGKNCVSPSTATVAAALKAAKPDHSGLLHVAPGSVGANAYPLVQVTYAAVRVTQPADALSDFAALITFAAGSGQTPGVLPGQLPHGYLPLPTNLRNQAKAAAARLVADAHATGTPTGGGTSAGSPQGASPGASGQVTAGSQPLAPPSSALPYSTEQASDVPTKATPATHTGTVRWVLLVVVVVGLVGACGGPLLRAGLEGRLSLPWRRR